MLSILFVFSALFPSTSHAYFYEPGCLVSDGSEKFLERVGRHASVDEAKAASLKTCREQSSNPGECSILKCKNVKQPSNHAEAASMGLEPAQASAGSSDYKARANCQTLWNWGRCLTRDEYNDVRAGGEALDDMQRGNDKREWKRWRDQKRARDLAHGRHR